MSIRKLALALLFFVFLIGLSGCYNNSWSFDFVGITAGDLNGFTKLLQDLPFSVNPKINGLELDGMALCLPTPYLGDMRAILKFDLLVDETHTANVAMALMSSSSYLPEDYVQLNCKLLGGSATFTVIDGGGGNSREIPTNVPRVNKSGGNVLEMIKKGDNYTVKLNGSTIASFEALYCTPTQLVPAFSATLDGGGVLFNSIRVEYND